MKNSIEMRNRGRTSLGLLAGSVGLAQLCLCWPAMADTTTGSTVDTLEEIIVTAGHVPLAPKTGVSLLETPQNIQVLSGQLLKDQGVTLLEDALRNVAGVMPDPYARGYDIYRIRGFDASAFTYVDGLPRGVELSIEPAALDSVEVIKGPSSVLFGSGPPGGLVNLVTKHPRQDTFVDAEISKASWGGYMPYLDAGTTFDRDGTVYGRVVALYRDEGSYLQFNPGVRRTYVAPSLTWEVSPDTKLTVLASISHERNELIPDQPATGLVLPNPNGSIDRTLYIGDPASPGRLKQDWDTVGFELRHTFSDQVSLYQNARVSYLDLDWLNLYQPLEVLPDQRTELEYSEDYAQKQENYSLDTGLNATFNTGVVEHTVNAGVEYDGLREHYSGALGYAPTIAFDLFDPNYSAFVYQPRTTPFAASTISNEFGLYLQDELHLTQQLTLTAGGRYDIVKINTVTNHSFVPRVGANYAVQPGIVPYVSFAKSFDPQAGYDDPAGNQLQPERGTQYEAGVKFATADGRANSTVSVFQVTRSNVAAQVPGQFTYQSTGLARSRGIEFDGQFRLTSAWELLASYSYLQAIVLRDTVIPVGSLILNTPRNKASLWTRYVIPAGPLKGLGFSAGGSSYSRQAGDDANSFFIPGYTLVNANVSYRWGRYSLLANVNNVTNRDYMRGSLSSLLVVGGEPRNYRLTLGCTF